MPRPFWEGADQRLEEQRRHREAPTRPEAEPLEPRTQYYQPQGQAAASAEEGGEAVPAQLPPATEPLQQGPGEGSTSAAQFRGRAAAEEEEEAAEMVRQGPTVKAAPPVHPAVGPAGDLTRGGAEVESTTFESAVRAPLSAQRPLDVSKTETVMHQPAAAREDMAPHVHLVSAGADVAHAPLLGSRPVARAPVAVETAPAAVDSRGEACSFVCALWSPAP